MCSKILLVFQIVLLMFSHGPPDNGNVDITSGKEPTGQHPYFISNPLQPVSYVRLPLQPSPAFVYATGVEFVYKLHKFCFLIIFFPLLSECNEISGCVRMTSNPIQEGYLHFIAIKFMENIFGDFCMFSRNAILTNNLHISRIVAVSVATLTIVSLAMARKAAVTWSAISVVAAIVRIIGYN